MRILHNKSLRFVYLLTFFSVVAGSLALFVPSAHANTASPYNDPGGVSLNATSISPAQGLSYKDTANTINWTEHWMLISDTDKPHGNVLTNVLGLYYPAGTTGAHTVRLSRP